MMRASLAVACVALIGLVVGCYGFPTPDECEATFDSIGEDSLEDALKPCALGASPTCCSALTSTLNVKSGQPLAGCMCNQEVMDAVGEILDQNSLARAVGFNLAKLQETGQKCGADFVGVGDCAAAVPEPRPAEPTPTPPAVPEPRPPTPSLKPQPQPEPRPLPQPRPEPPRRQGPKPQSGVKVPGDATVGDIIKGEDGQLYEVVSVPTPGAKFGRKTPFPIITQIYQTLDGVVDGVVDSVLGKSGVLTGMIG